MSDTFSVSPRVLSRLGLSIEHICVRAGVESSGPWLTDDFFRLWSAIDEELGDDSAGLRFGAHGIERGYGIPSMVALHAPDFRCALATLAKYKRLTCPEFVEVHVDGDDATVGYRWLQATHEVPRLLVDTTLASLNELARRGTGGRVAPIRVQLARRTGEHELLRRHFGCPIVFGAPYDAMVFERRALEASFVTADGGAFARVLDDAEATLVSGKGFSAAVGEVRVAIARQLSEGRSPALAAVARRLLIGQRTLQRRLGENGTSFQQQLDAVRYTTATRLLANTALDPIAISMLLGFAEPNSFARAFRMWEQTTPLRWRERHARQEGSEP